MRYATKLISVATLIGSLITPLAASPRDVPDWRKKLDIDPQTDPIIKRYAGPLDDKFAQAIRNSLLRHVLIGVCYQTIPENKGLRAYFKTLPPRPDESEVKSANIKARSTLIFIDVDSVHHLCSAIDYLFGHQGILIPDSLTAGTGGLMDKPDPSNPYVVIPMKF